MNSFKYFRSCKKVVEQSDAKCSNLVQKLKESPAQSFNLRVFMTQNDCTIPNIESPNQPGPGYELIKTINDIEASSQSINIGDFSLENLCGLVNFVSVISDSSDSYIEHSATPFFVNCSSFDFQIRVNQFRQNGSVESVTPGTTNPFKDTEFIIENTGFEGCEPRVRTIFSIIQC